VDLVGPTNPAVQKILQTQYAKLEAEFRKLHMETGVLCAPSWTALGESTAVACGFGLPCSWVASGFRGLRGRSRPLWRAWRVTDTQRLKSND
jgi:hypothetical protein